MKPILEKLLPNEFESFFVKKICLEKFDSPWHFHPEIELTLITKSSGNRYVGDSVAKFEAGDLVLIGKNTPHFWQNNEGNNFAESIVVQFDEMFLGKDFFQIPELHPIKILLEKAIKGLKFENKIESIEKMYDLLESKKAERVIKLIEILNHLSNQPHEILTSNTFAINAHLAGVKRIENVHRYVMQNFKQEISLNEAASIANLSKEAFCRYFKRTTGKTFSEYVNNFRLNYACKILKESELIISEIAFESGFNLPSYFNKVFFQKYNLTPKEYRKRENLLINYTSNS